MSSEDPRYEWCHLLNMRQDDGELQSKSDPTRCPRGLLVHCFQYQDLDKESHNLKKRKTKLCDSAI